MSLDDGLVRVQDEAVGAGEGEVGEGGILLQLLEAAQDAVLRPVEGADGDVGDHCGSLRQKIPQTEHQNFHSNVRIRKKYYADNDPGPEWRECRLPPCRVSTTTMDGCTLGILP